MVFIIISFFYVFYDTIHELTTTIIILYTIFCVEFSLLPFCSFPIQYIVLFSTFYSYFYPFVPFRYSIYIILFPHHFIVIIIVMLLSDIIYISYCFLIILLSLSLFCSFPIYYVYCIVSMLFYSHYYCSARFRYDTIQYVSYYILITITIVFFIAHTVAQ